METEVPDSELACLAGTADAERLSGILAGTEELAPEGMTRIMDCLQDETFLRMILGAFVEYTGLLSPKTSECISTSFAGIDPRGDAGSPEGRRAARDAGAGKTALALCAPFVEVIPNPGIPERFQREWRIC